jgi:hypothetical protein
MSLGRFFELSKFLCKRDLITYINTPIFQGYRKERKGGTGSPEREEGNSRND